jgi:hypothetical protein
VFIEKCYCRIYFFFLFFIAKKEMNWLVKWKDCFCFVEVDSHSNEGDINIKHRNSETVVNPDETSYEFAAPNVLEPYIDICIERTETTLIMFCK